MADQRGPLLGVDYGRARIGVAVADALGISTTPLGFVPRTTDNEAAIAVAALAAEQQAIAVVVGLPLHAGGDEGQSVARVRRFTKRLRRHSPLPVVEIDERWSSEEAESALRAEGAWPVAPGVLDARAAAIILRRYLDDDASESAQAGGAAE